MRIALAIDGNPESHAAWSGIARSVLEQLRAEGHEVRIVDVELKGPRRLAAAAATIAWHRDRWRARYTLGAVPFRLRSSAGARGVRALGGWPECGLQIGATFNAFAGASFPYFLCCDSNIAVAIRGRASGFSHATVLTASELDAVVRREAAVYSGASGIFTLSEQLRRSFIEDFEVPPQRVHRVGAGPNLDVAQISAPASVSPGGPPTILFIGAQFGRKGGDVLLRAFERVRASLPEARLIIIGPETAPASGEGIDCLGYLDKDSRDGWRKLMSAYQRAHVFCLPTRFEPFGIAFVEAMYFGLPCVGTATNAVPEIISDGETGYVVPVDDEAALAERLLRLLRDPELARRMGASGRRRAEELFSWRQVVERMVSAMEPALAK